MEYQMRNWYYFTWLSGDSNVEQHVHSLDKAAWAMRDEPPVRAWGLGGRQVRTDAQVRRHLRPPRRGLRVCQRRAGLLLLPPAGRLLQRRLRPSSSAPRAGPTSSSNRIEGADAWQLSRARSRNMYDVEHQDLFAAIRAGKPINNGLYMARSTMLAILGRMVDLHGPGDHLGRGDQLEADRWRPDKYAWDADPADPARRGRQVPGRHAGRDEGDLECIATDWGRGAFSRAPSRTLPQDVTRKSAPSPCAPGHRGRAIFSRPNVSARHPPFCAKKAPRPRWSISERFDMVPGAIRIGLHPLRTAP